MFSLKFIEVDDNQLTSDEILEYAEKFKIILEKKDKMDSAVFRFIVTRLIDTVFLASML